jgi:hypothetical protein
MLLIAKQTQKNESTSKALRNFHHITTHVHLHHPATYSLISPFTISNLPTYQPAIASPPPRHTELAYRQSCDMRNLFGDRNVSFGMKR